MPPRKGSKREPPFPPQERRDRTRGEGSALGPRDALVTGWAGGKASELTSLRTNYLFLTSHDVVFQVVGRHAEGVG
jgi:hypothetical protein